MNNKDTSVVFTPDNEPYLGRELLFHFDQLICSTMEQNALTAPTSYGCELTDRQQMACQIIAQAISLSLSIRELVRQGYLFGAHVLVRPLAERSTILLYLHLYPEEIAKWNSGWHLKDKAPSLAGMFDAIQRKQQRDPMIKGGDLTAIMNSLMHAKPDSAPWNLILSDTGDAGHAVSKILTRPDLCDDLCGDVIPWLAVVLGMVTAYFPSDDAA